jgi:hypothetical protein
MAALVANKDALQLHQSPGRHAVRSRLREGGLGEGGLKVFQQMAL